MKVVARAIGFTPLSGPPLTLEVPPVTATWHGDTLRFACLDALRAVDPTLAPLGPREVVMSLHGRLIHDSQNLASLGLRDGDMIVVSRETAGIKRIHHQTRQSMWKILQVFLVVALVLGALATFVFNILLVMVERNSTAIASDVMDQLILFILTLFSVIGVLAKPLFPALWEHDHFCEIQTGPLVTGFSIILKDAVNTVVFGSEAQLGVYDDNVLGFDRTLLTVFNIARLSAHFVGVLVALILSLLIVLKISTVTKVAGKIVYVDLNLIPQHMTVSKETLAHYLETIVVKDAFRDAKKVASLVEAEMGEEEEEEGEGGEGTEMAEV
jgi:hypothetical protein